MSPPNIDFADVFSPDLAFGLPEHIGINDRAIELVDDHPSHPVGCVHRRP